MYMYIYEDETVIALDPGARGTTKDNLAQGCHEGRPMRATPIRALPMKVWLIKAWPIRARPIRARSMRAQRGP